MSKKTIIFSLILIFFIVSGFGCKGLTQEQQALVKPITLNYWTVYNDLGVLQNLVAEYKKKRPYVNINIKQVRYEEFDKLFVNALADDVAPDIVSVQPRNLQKHLSRLLPAPDSVVVSNIYKTGQYFTETVVEPQTVTMPNTRYIQSQYVNTVYDDAVVGGQIYGLPLALDTMAVFYNKDILDKAGVPTPPTTWEEFMSAVKATTKLNVNGDIIQSGVALGTAKNIDNAFDIVSLFMMQSGVTMAEGRYVGFAGGLNPNNFENFPTVKALNFYVDFARPSKEIYSWNEKMGNALDEFARGRTAFYFGFSYDLPRIKTKAPQMNFEIIPLPQLNPAEPVNVADYWLESVVKKTKHPNEAWEFVAFLGEPQNVKLYTDTTRRPTPIRSQINNQKNDPELAPFVGSVLNAKNWYRGQDFATAKEAMNNLISSYLQPYEGVEKEQIYRLNLINSASSIIQQTM